MGRNALNSSTLPSGRLPNRTKNGARSTPERKAQDHSHAAPAPSCMMPAQGGGTVLLLRCDGMQTAGSGSLPHSFFSTIDDALHQSGGDQHEDSARHNRRNTVIVQKDRRREPAPCGMCRW